MRTLFLFDIDGTILLTHGVGRRTVEAVLTAQHGRPIRSDAVAFSGKTDPQIFRELLQAEVAAGRFDEARLDDGVKAALIAYEIEMASRMEEAVAAAQIEELPGARALIERLVADERAVLGLVTGNLETMAHLKLAALGLDGYFPFGGFGSDHEDRNGLVPLAVARAEAATGHRFTGRDVVVIGDTPRDVACGEAAGAFTVGVATGHFSTDDLEACGADLVLDTLRDADLLLDAVWSREAA